MTLLKFSGVTYGIVAHADCRCDVGICPQAALSEVKALFLEVLEFLGYS